MGDFDTLQDEAFPPLPPPHSPAEGGAEAEGGDGERSARWHTVTSSAGALQSDNVVLLLCCSRGRRGVQAGRRPRRQEEGGEEAAAEAGLPEVPLTRSYDCSRSEAAPSASFGRSRLLLFPLRLVSERGLPALRTLFHDVRFKGKGHEVRHQVGFYVSPVGRKETFPFRLKTKQQTLPTV